MRKTSHANRGMKLEQHIESKCTEYHKDGIALIHKIPTEFKIIRNGARIVSAFPVKDSKFVDFVGVYDGKALAMECKETQNKTSFPLSNISNYQFEFINLWLSLGGNAYFVIHFSIYNETYLINGSTFLNYILTLERKSIPYSWFKEECVLVENYDFIKYI